MNCEPRIRSPPERDRYLECLGRAAARAGTRLLGYCAMSTHNHLVGPGDAARLGPMLHRANTAYGAWWNRENGGFGRVFAERPRSVVVSSEEQLARLLAYVHNNPVLAGVVASPADSDWSSHRAFIGERATPPWLDVAWALAATGYSSSPSGRASFRDYVASRAGLPRDPTLSGPGPLPADAWARLTSVVADRLAVDPSLLARPGRDERAATARRQAVWIAVDVMGMTAVTIARETGLSATLVARLVREGPTAGLSTSEIEQVMEAFLARQRSDTGVRCA